MQHHDVQRVALDPFAAIEQPAQGADRRVDLDAERILDGMYAAHLIGDRTDPADAGDDVEHLTKAATAQQCLEEAWRLEDAESNRIDRARCEMQFERALAFDARDVVDLDRSTRHGPRSPCGMPRRLR